MAARSHKTSDVPIRDEHDIHRLVVKVGTSTLTDASGCLDRPFIADLAAQLAYQRNLGRDIILVSSGAICVGKDRLAHRLDSVVTIDPGRHSAALPYKQAAAAVGQGLLMATYTEAFSWRNSTVAQVLLTREDLADRGRFLNARNTLLALLELGVIPIINENDTIAVEEIKFGDNDNLAALVAVIVEADMLLILSDVAGLYTHAPDPESSEPPEVIPIVSCIDLAIESRAGGAGSKSGTGGMHSKIQAARVATASGVTTMIAHGRRPGVITEAADGQNPGTLFLPGDNRLKGRKRWIAAGSRARGNVTVNPCAVQKLKRNGVSLLAVGITTVAGDFESGDMIEVRDENGVRFARGLTNYPSEQLRQIVGKHSDEFEAILGHKSYEEVIHRDNLVVVK